MIFIDQHYCFNGGRWVFPDRLYHGIYRPFRVYQNVTGWESFEPRLPRIEAIDYSDLWRCAAKIPHEWIEHDGAGLFELGQPTAVASGARFQSDPEDKPLRITFFGDEKSGSEQ